eukprot:2417519-Rhodomonas_salina.1
MAVLPRTGSICYAIAKRVAQRRARAEADAQRQRSWARSIMPRCRRARQGEDEGRRCLSESHTPVNKNRLGGQGSRSRSRPVSEPRYNGAMAGTE